MNESRLIQTLSALPLGGVRYFPSIGSTNDAALAWAAEGATDFSLVFADEQTAGRGRGDHKWYTPPGSALATSLILHPTAVEKENPALLTGLAALALVDALGTLGIQAHIKWPNDVLIDGNKVAGILVETVWLGDQLESCVIGVGINVLTASVPPPAQLFFPATSIENALGYPPDRMKVLHSFLTALAGWRTKLGSEEFLTRWEQTLAFRMERVQLLSDDAPPLIGRIAGLNTDGSLNIQREDDSIVSIRFGDVHLRPGPG